MENVVHPCNKLVESLADFLRENEFKPYKDFEHAFEKIINNHKQAIIFRLLLHSNAPNLICCVININKMLLKQDELSI